MASEFDKILEKIEKEMWANYSEIVIDLAQNPRNMGSIKNPDACAQLAGSCGDTLQIELKVKDNVITEIAFWANGCGTTLAAGSMVTELAKGKVVKEVLKITPLKVLDALGGLPDESIHCAFLAANTLHEAAKNYLKLSQTEVKSRENQAGES